MEGPLRLPSTLPSCRLVQGRLKEKRGAASGLAGQVLEEASLVMASAESVQRPLACGVVWVWGVLEGGV
jgi:hypothetical protein